MTSKQALQQNVGNCRFDVKRKAQVEFLHKRESSKAEHRDGVARSSDEVSVMEMERRGYPI